MAHVISSCILGVQLRDQANGILSFPLNRFPMGKGHRGYCGSPKAARGICKPSGLLPNCRIPAPPLADGEGTDDGSSGTPVYWPQHVECTETAGPGEPCSLTLRAKKWVSWNLDLSAFSGEWIPLPQTRFSFLRFVCVLFCFFDTGFLYVTLAILELTL